MERSLFDRVLYVVFLVTGVPLTIGLIAVAYMIPVMLLSLSDSFPSERSVATIAVAVTGGFLYAKAFGRGDGPAAEVAAYVGVFVIPLIVIAISVTMLAAGIEIPFRLP